MKTQYFFGLCLLLTQVSLAQKQGQIWYFGEQAGLDFSSGSPVSILDGQTYFVGGGLHNEGCSVISDEDGNLLFYSNGEQVWNRLHQIMPNGDGLLGHASSTHAAFIVPQPGNEERFYIFTTDSFFENNLQFGLRYSIVDICKDAGFGDVIPASKNTLLLNNVAEKIAVTRHANGKDYWIVVHKYLSDAFHAFRLTENGITDEIISKVGSVHDAANSNPNDTQAAIGQMKISPNGRKLALILSNRFPSLVELFDFDPTSGQIFNPIQLPTTLQFLLYGIEFSPDNSKLYVSQFWNIYQYDLRAGGRAPIQNSSNVIAQAPSGESFGGMQLGPDGKIYIAKFSDTISVIENPNTYGLGCNFINKAVGLSGRECSQSLPSFIAAYDYANTSTECVGISLSPSFLNFKVNWCEEAVCLSWQALDPSSQAFRLSRSFDARTYQEIAQIDVILGQLNYSLQDEDFPQNKSSFYYRLESLNAQGEVEQELIRYIEFPFSSLHSIKLFPNPLLQGKMLNIEFSDISQIQQVIAIDMWGRSSPLEVHSNKEEAAWLDTSLLASGVYVLLIRGKKERIFRKVLIN